MSHSSTRILLLSQRRILAEPLAIYLNRSQDLTAVSLHDSTDQALRSVNFFQFDVALLDTALPRGMAFDLGDRIRRHPSTTHLIFLADAVSDVTLQQALRLNARGFLLASEAAETLADSVRRVVQGHTVFSHSVSRRIIFDSDKRRHVLRFDSPLTSLTNRQIEILHHLCEGESVKTLAGKMHLSPKSVESHKYRIMKKLGIHNAVGLARYAIREGLVDV